MGRWIRHRVAGSLLVGALLTGVVAGALAAGGAGRSVGSSAVGHPVTGSSLRPYVVAARTGQTQWAASAVRSLGGSVGRSLPIVGGFAARLPASAERLLAANPAVAHVATDTAVRFSDLSFNAATTASNYAKSTGATTAWDAGNLGSGVTVAVIDTGIAPVDDLAGRVIAGPDFSGEGDSTVDSYGHGTVIAGVIAGDGTASAGQAGGAYVGMAPQAKVLSVKVAGRNGATDVSTVLAAMQWIGSHRTQYNIRVVELAWGTPSDQSPSIDPLDFAVERLWHSGVVVVAAAGNDGPTGHTVTKPGDDPLIITAGAYNDFQNLNLGDDAVALWSSRGPTAAAFDKPDLVAPGRLIVSTKSPGSTIDRENADARVGAAYIRGSGTSQASAVTSGSVALLLSARTWLQPDQVKYALTSATMPINIPTSVAEGNGRLWYPGSLAAKVWTAPVQQFAGSGLGSLEGSRGGRHVETVCAGTKAPTAIIGEVDALCLPWDPDSWTSDSWTSDSWTSAAWSSDSWTSDSWTSDSWTSDSWTSGFLTAFWGNRTPWWHPLPGEVASAAPAGSAPYRSAP